MKEIKVFNYGQGTFEHEGETYETITIQDLPVVVVKVDKRKRIAYQLVDGKVQIDNPLCFLYGDKEATTWLASFADSQDVEREGTVFMH